MDFSKPPDTAVAGIVMVDRHNNFLLQKRDERPDISNPGMIGMFGGHKEGNETDVECALREVAEETGLMLSPDLLDLVVSTRVEYGNGICREGTFYLARNIDPSGFVVTEGSLFVVPVAEVGRHFADMVPTTVYVISLICEELRRGMRTLDDAGKP